MDIKSIFLITFLISALLVIHTNATSSTNSTSSTDDKTKREDEDGSSSDDDSSDSSSSDSRPSPMHTAFGPMASPYPMFPRMPFPGMPPMNPYMFRPIHPQMSPMSAHPMAASMIRPVMSPFPGGQPQPLFAPMNPMTQMSMASMATHPAMRRAWEEPHPPMTGLTGNSLLDQLLRASESHADPLSEPFGQLGGLPIEQMDEDEFYEKLRQHQRQKDRQVASRREFRESSRDDYRGDGNYRRRPYNGGSRSQIPPPPSPTYSSSYDDRHRDNGYHDNHRNDPYEPMQEENRYDRGHHDGNNNYVGNNQRDPMEYDDRPPVDGPPPPPVSRSDNRPPGEDRPPYVRRQIHDERSPDYPIYDDKA